MIDVDFTKWDPYMGKSNTKTTKVATEERARAKAAAIASVNKLPEGAINEEKDADGALVRITITVKAEPPLEPVAVDKEPRSDLAELRARIEVLEQLAGIKRQ